MLGLKACTAMPGKALHHIEEEADSNGNSITLGYRETFSESSETEGHFRKRRAVTTPTEFKLFDWH